MRSCLALAVVAPFALITGCPKTLDEPPPPFEGVNLDAGPTIVVTPPDDGVPPDDAEVIDAGPANTTVIVERIEPAAGPLAGLNRIRLVGTGFTGACVLEPEPGSGPCDVWFGDVQAAFVTPAGTGLSAISVQVPPGVAPGPVDVKVLTSLGVAVVENGYTYFSPLRIDDIEPRAGSTDGGDLVTLTGESFSDDMLVTVGGRQVVGLVVDADGRGATFLTPPGEVGRADVVATDAFGQSTVGLGFTYRGPLRLQAVDPNLVDTAGGDVVDLVGSGFFLGDGVGSGFDVNAAPILAPGVGPFGGGTGTGTGDDDEPGASFNVTIGGAAAAVVNVISEERVRVTAPPLAPGLHDVVVTRGALSDALVDALLVRAPLTGAFAVQGVVPSRFDVDGGTRVTLVGEALTSVSTVAVAGVSASDVVIVDDRTLTFVAPAAADGVAGPALVTVTRADGSAVSTDALYVVPLSIDVVTPASGSVNGGTVVTVRGRALDGVVAMTFGGIPAVDVLVVDDETLTATTPAGAAGFVDVAVVNAAGERAVLRDGFRFIAPLRVVAVQPARGVLNGNTFVTVVGTGFTNGASSGAGASALSLSFADNAAREIVVVNDSVLTARTPPRNEPGTVDVTASIGIDTHALADAFTYFRTSGNVTGGARGGPIDGAVYVSALDSLTGSAIPGLVAWVGTDDTPVAAAITDALGTATVSGPAVRGPQTVTIAGDCFGTVTFVDVDAAELTAFVPNLCPPPPPPPGPGELPPPSTIRGRVFGFAKEFFDPENLDQSGCGLPAPAKCEIAFAEVQTSLESPFSQNPFIVSDNIALEEGDEYEITPTRTGRMAVVAIAGILDTNNNDFRLVQLGVRREINIGIGEELIDQDIDLDIALDEELDMFMSDAPLRGSIADSDVDDIGFQPTVTRVVPFLQLAGEGAYLYTLGFEGDRNMVLEEMPDIRGDALTFFAGAYTTDGDNMYTDVGTANLVEDSVRVSGNGNEAEWSARNANDTAFLAAGLVFVAERPDGTRFASAIEAVVDETPGTPAGPFVLRLQDAPDFDATAASYHIGAPGPPSSEILQDGVGNITGTASGGVTLSPFLGLAEVITPARDGVLVDRMLRWRAPFGQQPSIHRHILTNAFAPTTSVWQVFNDGARTKVILPRIPDAASIIAVLPFDQRTCLTEPSTSPIAAPCAQRYGELSNADDFIAPSDLALGAIRWRHEQILAPNVTNTDWSFLQIGLRNRRAWTTDVHGFVHGLD